MYDYLFRQGVVIDGTGTPGQIADVAVSDGRIARIKPQILRDARQVIDIRGQILTPGFIDVHSHSDVSLLYENNPGSKIFQGITTEIIGNCGFSPFPLKQDSQWLKQRRLSLAFIDVESVDWDWETYEQYRKRLKAAAPNVNLVTLTGHGSLRALVMGYERKKADRVQRKQMCELLTEHFREGVVGLSTGLGYAPDFYADEEELTELAKVVKEHDKIFTFHVRGERATLFQAVNEVISIGRKSGAKVHISHLKCAGIYNAGKSAELLQLIDQSLMEGVDISFDMYPYTAGSSNLGLLFPPAYHEGGLESLLARLKEPLYRKDIIKQMEEGTCGWSTFIGEQQGVNLMITSLKVHKECMGKRISEIALGWNCSPSEAACRLMVDEGGKVEMIMFLTSEKDMDRIAVHEKCLYGTDGLAMGEVKSDIRQMPHPRYYGSFPLLITGYGGKGMIPMEKLIHKMTGAAAKRFHIDNRGFIKEGFWADLTVLDLKQLSSPADYKIPRQLSEGVSYLMVNGKLEISDGAKTGAVAGIII